LWHSRQLEEITKGLTFRNTLWKVQQVSPPTAVPIVLLAGKHQSAALAILAFDCAVKSVQFGDIHASLAGALEELRLHQMALAIGGAPHGVRVALL